MSAFSLINNNLLMFLLLNFFFFFSFYVCFVFCFLFFFFCRNSWLLSYLFGTDLLGYPRGCLLGLSSQEVCQIRHNCQTLCCPFFFFFVPSGHNQKSMFTSLLPHIDHEQLEVRARFFTSFCPRYHSSFPHPCIACNYNHIDFRISCKGPYRC